MSRRRTALLALVVLCVCVSLSALSSGEVFWNTTGKLAYGLRLTFSEPVEITSNCSRLPVQQPDGKAAAFVLTGGQVQPWEACRVTWEPASAVITYREWVLQDEACYVCRDSECLEAGLRFDYLIVTRPLFVEGLSDFSAWKSAQGFRVGLVMVEWLDGQFEGRHLAERMKTGMHFLRRNAGVVYVLFVGDTSVERGNFTTEAVLQSYDLSIPWNVPTGYNRRAPSDPPGTVLSRDTYFVEDRDWDENGVGMTELQDQRAGKCGVLDATLFLGRWSVRTPWEIPAIVKKTKSVSPTDHIMFINSKKSVRPREDFPCPPDWPPLDDLTAPVTATQDSRLSPTSVNPCLISVQCYRNIESVLVPALRDSSPWLTVRLELVDIDNPQETGRLRQELAGNKGAIVVGFHSNYSCTQVWAGVCARARFSVPGDLPAVQRPDLPCRCLYG